MSPLEKGSEARLCPGSLNALAWRQFVRVRYEDFQPMNSCGGTLKKLPNLDAVAMPMALYGRQCAFGGSLDCAFRPVGFLRDFLPGRNREVRSPLSPQAGQMLPPAKPSALQGRTDCNRVRSAGNEKRNTWSIKCCANGVPNRKSSPISVGLLGRHFGIGLRRRLGVAWTVLRCSPFTNTVIRCLLNFN